MEEESSALKKVPIELIHPNPWNPFSMRPELFEALVRHIEREGMFGQIVVRRCPCLQIKESHYEIIDGENRFFAAQDRRIDLQEINCLIVEKDDVEARLETINYNLEHGELIPEKFDALLKDIERRGNLSRHDIATKLFVRPEDLATKLPLVNTNLKPVKIEFQAKMPTFTISTRMHSRKDYEFVNSILQSIMKDEECDEASAMISVFGAYSKEK